MSATTRTPPDKPTPRRFLTTKQLCEELAISRSTLYDWLAKGCAPPHIKLPNNALRFPLRSLDTWLAERGETRDE